MTMIFSSSSAREFIIIAGPYKHRFRIVFDVVSYGNNEHALQMVDLDGDSYPEILAVPRYVWRKNHPNYLIDPVHTRAQVWKWSPSRFDYVMVRETSYFDRLKPLRLRRS